MGTTGITPSDVANGGYISWASTDVPALDGHALFVVLLVTFTLTFVGGLLVFCLLAAYLSLLWEIS